MLPCGAVAPLLAVPRWEHAQYHVGWKLRQLLTPIVATSSLDAPCLPAINLLKLLGSLAQ